MRIKINRKVFLVFVLSLQFSFLGSIILDCLGLEVPIIRQSISFIYLTFIPGILIFGIFRDIDLTRVETFLYSIGLSLFFLMSLALVMNFLYPKIDITHPISTYPLAITISSITLLLCCLWYLRNEQFLTVVNISINNPILPYIFALLLIPFLAIFGAILLNFYNDNTFLLFLIALLSLLLLLAVLDKVPKETYTLVVWVISISLLLQATLASSYIAWGWDMTKETSFSALTTAKGYWDSSIQWNINALPSIVLLQPVYSILTDLNIIWTRKIIYPIIYSILPVIAFQYFRRQLNDKNALVSCFYLMVFYSFYTLLSRNIRTGTAEVFMALVLLTVTDDRLSFFQKKIFSIIFLISLILSHHATSYIFLYALITALVIHTLLRRLRSYKTSTRTILLSPTYVALAMILTISWYMYTTGSTGYNTLVSFSYDTLNTIFTEFFTPKGSLSKYFQEALPLSIQASKYLLIISTGFIVVGILDSLLDLISNKPLKFQYEYIYLSMAFSVILFTSLYVAKFNIARIGHILLLLLSPFLIVGINRLITSIKFFWKYSGTKENKSSQLFASIFLIILFLFSSGFFSETLIKGDDYAPHILISKNRIMSSKTITSIEAKDYLYKIYVDDQDFASSRWLMRYKSEHINIKASAYSYLVRDYRIVLPEGKAHIYRAIENIVQTLKSPEELKDKKDSYIYFRCYNFRDSIIISKPYEYPINFINTSEFLCVINKEGKGNIYNNGCSRVYI